MLTLTNARIFDGSAMLPGKRSVTIDAGRITAVGSHPPAPAEKIIDIGGMTLLPGLISVHLHPDFYKFTLPQGIGRGSARQRIPARRDDGDRHSHLPHSLESGFTGYVGASCQQ